jgi:photosystem II stability/assembly factor-like uncharacterized protein
VLGVAQPVTHFASSTAGWLYAVPELPDKHGGVLWRTTDGGRTWAQAATTGATVALVAHGERVWRVERFCPANADSSPRSCRVTVFTSVDTGAHWSPLIVQPPVSGNLEGFSAPSAAVAYVLSNNDPPGNSDRTRATLTRTSDGGRSWQQIQAPCTGFVGEDLATSLPLDLWYVCHDQPGSGAMAPKHLYRSTDGGGHWSTDLGAPNLGAGGETAAGSPQRACRGGSRTSISCTRDGGRHWFFPGPDGAENPLDGGVTMLEFADPDHGWALGQDGETGSFDVLWGTTDGGETWFPSAIDPDGARLFVVPGRGPVGTTVTIIGEHCTSASKRQADLVFETTAGQRPEGAAEIGSVPVDEHDHFSVHYRIPTEMHPLQGSGDGAVTAGRYQIISKPPACHRPFEVTQPT